MPPSKCNICLNQPWVFWGWFDIYGIVNDLFCDHEQPRFDGKNLIILYFQIECCSPCKYWLSFCQVYVAVNHQV